MSVDDDDVIFKIITLLENMLSHFSFPYIIYNIKLKNPKKNGHSN
jgi:hypothetical protein